jgi:hypothetical protein
MTKLLVAQIAGSNNFKHANLRYMSDNEKAHAATVFMSDLVIAQTTEKLKW